MGQNLIEISVRDSIIWRDGETVWCDGPGVNWYSESVIRLSNEDYSDRRYWSDDIISYTPPQFSIAGATGGYCRMDFGNIELTLNVFAGKSKTSGNALFTDSDVVWLDGETEWIDDALVSGDPTLWPPPREINLRHQYTETDEAGLVLTFVGTGHLATFDRESVHYDLYGDKYDTDLLKEVVNYDGDTVTLPLALGAVHYVTPVRQADVGGFPVYHKGGLSGALAVEVASIADNGSGKARFTTSIAHGFTNLDTVTVEVSNPASTYNTTQIATVIDGTHFDFPLIAYVDDLGGHSFKTGYWRIYDDGVPISGNATDNVDGTFTLDTTNVGNVSISGTGTITTLSDLLTYLSTNLDPALSYTYDAALEGTSPTISYWADSQQLLVDFVSEVAKYFETLFYISNSTIYAVAMDKTNGTRTLTEYDFFPVTYDYPTPISLLKAEWATREAGEWVDGGKYVKSTDEEETVTSGYPYGSEENVTPYQYVRAGITTRLASLLTAKHKCQVQLSIPMSDSLPVPGEQLTYTDESSFTDALDVTMFCRNLIYNFDQDTVVITGDGVLT